MFIQAQANVYLCYLSCFFSYRLRFDLYCCSLHTKHLLKQWQAIKMKWNGWKVSRGHWTFNLFRKSKEITKGNHKKMTTIKFEKWPILFMNEATLMVIRFHDRKKKLIKRAFIYFSKLEIPLIIPFSASTNEYDFFLFHFQEKIDFFSISCSGRRRRTRKNARVENSPTLCKQHTRNLTIIWFDQA